jgi:4'-phosphopantetheinyl transferase EntD
VIGPVSGRARLADVLPAGVASAETHGDLAPLYEFDEEAAVLSRMVASRRREFLTARRCAHEALTRLGRAPVPIAQGADRAPVWPAGVTGSITHCAGYRAAAVSDAAKVRAVGIDAEPHRGLAPGVGDLVLRPDERDQIAELQRELPALAWPTLAFSAKEAFYKAWYPSHLRWLGFHDVRLRLDPEHRAFEVRVVADAEAGVTMSGRYVADDELVITAVTVLADGLGPPGAPAPNPREADA